MDVISELLVAFALICAGIYYYNYLKFRRVHKFMRQFPTEPEIPFLGHALSIKKRGFLNNLHHLTDNYGSLVPLRVGMFRMVLVVSDYKFLEFLLSTNKVTQKSLNYRFIEPWLGQGLITSWGPHWKTHRKIITPCFHFKILEEFIDIFDSLGNVLVKRLKEKSGSKSLDIFPYISLYALDVICKSAMGVSMNAQEDEDNSYVRSVKEMSHVFMVRSSSLLYDNELIYPLTATYQIQKAALRILDGFCRDLVIEKRKAFEEKASKVAADIDNIGLKRKRALLDMMLETTVDGQNLNDQEIMDEVATFTFAGHDTTSTAISFILYCLANHPEIQDKVLEEQKSIFGDIKSPKVSYNDLQNMKYLDLVMKESLRLYPPVPIYGRKVTEDVEYDGMSIPKETSLLIFARAIHMNPEYFPDPEKFDPGRFENNDGHLPYAYIPFSAGSRNCIGQKFATLEIKSAVSKIVRNFELLPAFPAHKLDLASDLVLKSNSGIKIGLKTRDL